MIRSIVCSVFSVCLFTGSTNMYVENTRLEEQVKMKQNVIEVIKHIPCDSSKFYKAGVEAGRKQNWHFSDKNITIVKEGDNVRYDIQKDSVFIKKNKQIVKGVGKINYHYIEIK